MYHYAKFKHKYYVWDLEDVVTRQEKRERLRRKIESILGIRVENSKQVLRLLTVYENIRERGLTS